MPSNKTGHFGCKWLIVNDIVAGIIIFTRAFCQELFTLTNMTSCYHNIGNDPVAYDA